MTALFWCSLLVNVVSMVWFWRGQQSGWALVVAGVSWAAAMTVWLLK